MLSVLAGLILGQILRSYVRENRIHDLCCRCAAEGIEIRVIGNDDSHGSHNFIPDTTATQIPYYVRIHKKDQVDHVVELLRKCNFIRYVDFYGEELSSDDMRRVLAAGPSITRVFAEPILAGEGD